MAARNGGRCVYCGKPMTMPKPGNNGHQDPRTATDDHLFPQAGDQAFILSLPPEKRRLNIVRACHADNLYKGMLHPLDWIVIMPDPLGAARTADLLVQMGVPTADVDAALARRKRPVAT